MFGGLDVKGGSNNDEKNESESGFSFLNSAEPAAASAADMPAPKSETSGFSFIANDTAAAPAPSPSGTDSGFSFLQQNPAEVEEKEAPAAIGSGFSFLQQNSTEEKPAEASAPSESGFSFLQQKIAEEDDKSVPAPSATDSAFSFLQQNQSQDEEKPVAEAPAPSSGFSFMSSAAPAVAPTDIDTSSNRSFLATNPINSTVNETPGITKAKEDSNSHAPVSVPPTGAGVTFGGAATKKREIKRRSRAPRVGGGIATYSNPPAQPISEPPSSTYSSPPPPPAALPDLEKIQPVADTVQNVKDHAEEANRRAEEFLKSKLRDEEETVSAAGLNSPSSPARKLDDEYAEAARAAEQAQAHMTKSGPLSWFGRRRSDASKSGEGRLSRSDSGNVHRKNSPLPNTAISNLSHHSSQSIPSPAQSQHETPADRLLREQSDIKKAMADRQLRMSLQEQDPEREEEKTTYDDKPPLHSIPAKTDSNDLAAQSVPSWSSKTAAAPLPPPPPPSPRQLMNILLQQFKGDVKRAMQKVAELRQQRTMLLEERFVALAKERLASQQIVQTETQQLDAAEEEDFELADRLQVVLDGHNREKFECTAILENISKALEQLDQQTPGVVLGVVSCFESAEKEFLEFKKKQEKADNHSDAMQKFAATAKQLSNEEERLSGESKQLEREEELVKMEREELDKAIGEQTSEIEEKRDESESKLKEVQSEIEKIRETLRLKEAEEKKLVMDIRAQDVEIQKILLNFQRQITRVQKKESSSCESRKEWKKEQSTYEKHREEHEAEVTAHSEALLQFNEIMDAIDTEIVMARKFKDITTTEVTFEHIREASEVGDLAQLQVNVVKCEAAVSEAAQLVKASEETLANLENENKSIIEKLPNLDAEKKQAAAKRDFRTAGKASKEIKEAQARLRELGETLISEGKVKRDEAQVLLEKVQEELEKEKAMANEKEKVSGKAVMEKLSNSIKALLETKKEVCGNASADTVKGIGALVLQGQIDALKIEGQTLGDKFGGWEELLSELEKEHEIITDEQNDKTKDTEELEEEVTVSKPTKEEEEPKVARRSDEVDRTNVNMARELMKKLADAEVKLAGAVDNEDYDLAAELDETLESIKSELEKLDLTDAETDLALVDEVETDTSSNGTTEMPPDSNPTDEIENTENPIKEQEKEETTKEDEDGSDNNDTKNTEQDEMDHSVDDSGEKEKEETVEIEADANNEAIEGKNDNIDEDAIDIIEEDEVERRNDEEEDKPVENGDLADPEHSGDHDKEDDEKISNGTSGSVDNSDFEEEI